MGAREEIKQVELYKWTWNKETIPLVGSLKIRVDSPSPVTLSGRQRRRNPCNCLWLDPGYNAACELETCLGGKKKPVELPQLVRL